MILFVGAFLLSISVGCLSWVIANQVQSQKLLDHRLDNILTAAGRKTSARNQDENSSPLITLDESFRDSLTRKLYLAGARTIRHVRFFIFLRNMALILPVLLILGYTLTNQLHQVNILRSIAAGVTFYIGMHLITAMMVSKRKIKVMKSMPQLFDLLVIALEAGVHFNAALPRILREMERNDPLVQEFEIMHHEFLAGLTFAEACERTSKRCEVQDLSVILNALVESERLGSSLAPALRIQAEELRDKIRQRAREKAHQIPVKLLLPMIMVLAAIMLIVLGPLGFKMNKTMKSVTHFKKQNNIQSTAQTTASAEPKVINVKSQPSLNKNRKGAHAQ